MAELIGDKYLRFQLSGGMVQHIGRIKQTVEAQGYTLGETRVVFDEEAARDVHQLVFVRNQ
jgi:hypothetical protein